MDWPKGKDFGMSPEEEVTHTEDAPPYNRLPENEKSYALVGLVQNIEGGRLLHGVLQNE